HLAPSTQHLAPSTQHPAPSTQHRDLGDVVLLPGLINAHIHLELSWLRGRVPPANKFTDWVKQLIPTRRGVERAGDPSVMAPLELAIAELRASGTVAVGDISNSLASAAPMAAAGLRGVIFHELLGFQERDGKLVDASREARAAAASHGVPVSMAPHAPYSTSPELFRAIRDEVDRSACAISSVHLGESEEEVELLTTGTGPWRGMLEFIGAWRDDWPIPNRGPVEYLEGLGVLDGRTLVVHGVQLTAASLARVAAIGATLVTCPRSNYWVGVGYPPIERFYQSGVAVAVGTDSLASVEDLNLFSELKTMRDLAPSVPPRRFLESATLVGARALGLEAELGSLTPGKRAAMISVDLRGHDGDVEEYLVSGITPEQVQVL
ncbi:MAG: amidohydrolase family protein, partial [Vicinamibacterales bacterium]